MPPSRLTLELNGGTFRCRLVSGRTCHHPEMDVDKWWPLLDGATRQWVIDHNGESVPDDIADAIERAGGPGRSSAEWSRDEDSGGRLFDDGVVDRVEALGNGEA